MADAATIKPKFVPNFALLGRDDSGGPEWQPRTAVWGDGGYAVGEGQKGHLSPRGGGEPPLEGSEQDSTIEVRNRGRQPRRKGDESEARE